MSNQAVIPMEWFLETLNKRLGPPFDLKLKDLFVCIPFHMEAEFDYEIPRKLFWEGNDFQREYPYLFNYLGANRKDSSIKVFFVNPERLTNPLILWHKKYGYPKISKPKVAKAKA